MNENRAGHPLPGGPPELCWAVRGAHGRLKTMAGPPGQGRDGYAGSSHHHHAPRRRGIQYAETSRFDHNRLGLLDRPPSRTMTSECASTFSRHDLSELCCSNPPSSKGRREGRELAAPMARLQKKSRRQSPQVRPRHPGPPCTNGFTAYTCSPQGPAVLPLSIAESSAPQSWRQHRDARTTRFRRPRHAVRPHVKHMLRHVAAIASHLASRDDRDTPLLPRRDARRKARFPKKRK